MGFVGQRRRGDNRTLPESRGRTAGDSGGYEERWSPGTSAPGCRRLRKTGCGAADAGQEILILASSQCQLLTSARRDFDQDLEAGCVREGFAPATGLLIVARRREALR